MIQRIIRRAIRAFLRRPLLSVLLLVVLFGGLLVGGLLAFRPGLIAFQLPFGDRPVASSSATHSEPNATENYLKGNQTFNADLMWSSLAPEAQERFRSRGATSQDLQRQMDAAREAGTKLDEFSYIGGQNLPDGTSMHFYLVLTRGPQSRSDAQYVPYIFTLDRSGKIARVQ